MHYSQYFNLGHREFVETGAFNGFTDADSQLHIDPMLLKVCNEPEFQTAFQDYLQFFNEIVVLVENVEHDNMTDRCYRAIYNKLQFPEKVNSGLGYSRSNTKGSGISSRLSLQLTESCIDIVRRGVKNPVFFTLLPFIEKGIGADRISDMVISVLSNHFAQYTKRVCEELSIITKRCKLNGDICYLPLINKKPYFFIPQAILAHLPLARSYDDIDTVCHYNKVLREKICKAIGISWTEFERLNKNQRKDIILNNSALYKDIMGFYDKMVFIPYSFWNDPLGQYSDVYVQEEITAKNPLNLMQFISSGSINVLGIARQICQKYKDLIEKNHMYWLLYNDNHTLRDEKAAQYLFYSVAYAYCEANDIDINRENDPGVGELDFKLSQGFWKKVVIEVKKASNGKLVDGFKKQLPAYEDAERTPNGIYLVLKDSKATAKNIEKLEEERSLALSKGLKCPEIIYIDVTEKPSASKLK